LRYSSGDVAGETADPPHRTPAAVGMIPPRPRQMIRGQPHRPAWTGWVGLSPARTLRSLGRFGGLGLGLWLTARAAGLRLRHRCGPRHPLGHPGTGGIVAVVTYRGTPALLPGFLQHHRRLGIAEFVFLDLSVAGDLAVRLAAEPGCAVWAPRSDWRPGEAVHMLNALRHRYAHRRWCLSLESTDLFVYHRCEGRRIQSLLDFVSSEHRDHVFALVVDMYAEQPAAGLVVPADAAAAHLLPYFDPIGYHTAEPATDRSVTVRGGPRRRTQFAAMPWESPALDRVPLVKWRRIYGYVDDTSRLHPPRLNTPHAPWHSSPTGCLLRLALLDCAPDGAARRPAAATDAAATDAAATDAAATDLAELSLHNAVSRRYTSSADLVDCGLLNPGQWF
jgi:hypothetical protein